MSNVAAVSRRATYCHQFQTILKRVRCAVNLQKEQKEKFLSLSLSRQNQALCFPGKTAPKQIATAVASSSSSPAAELPTKYYRFSATDVKVAQFFSQLDDQNNRMFSLMLRVPQEELQEADMDVKKLKKRSPGVRFSTDQVECVVQECSSKLSKSLMELFPAGLPEDEIPNLSAIVISHKTNSDMSSWSHEMEAERDSITDQFVQTAIEIVAALKANGVWADFVDPSSGRPYYSPYTNATLFETDDRYKHFGFNIQDLGCCKALEHPVWKTNAFVGCILTTAGPNHPILKEIVQSKIE
ncbi:hypothetical protein RvY_02786 [Ramazzottius varieornatus]|uniref:Methylmalonic aciduria and homocystinuria type D protein, mitochondrial n=1 Tax=Ramazzottius varieornatus TaxID=947166 RepID=A0A1D1URM4_RAMVA|nr:hypothetical protein RvY_02786 [Ramazzottius varieornatus]